MKTKTASGKLTKGMVALLTSIFAVPVGASIMCALYMLSTKISPWMGVIAFIAVVGYITQNY